MYYIYMLRCKDNSIYTGITNDINRRMEEHFNKDKKCAKYTFTHTAKKAEQVWITENRKLASKLEYHIKRLSKEQKEKLIKTKKFDEILSDEKIDFDKYTIFDFHKK